MLVFAMTELVLNVKTADEKKKNYLLVDFYKLIYKYLLNEISLNRMYLGKVNTALTWQHNADN